MADFMGRVRSFRLTTAFGKLLEATSIPIKKSCLKRSKNLPQRNTKVLAKEYKVLNSYGLVLCALCVCLAHFALKILFLKKAVSTDLRIYRKGIQGIEFIWISALCPWCLLSALCGKILFLKKSCLNRSENLPQMNTKVLPKEYEVLNSYGLVLCALGVCFAHFAVKNSLLRQLSISASW